MPGSFFKAWLFIFIFISALGVMANEQQLMEIIEFLGEWTDEQGADIDFEMFDEPQAQRDYQQGHDAHKRKVGNK